jgi:hypothetical protein
MIRAQAQALAELSTPLIPINDQVVVMPLVVSTDSRRAQQVIEGLLQGISSSRTRVAIIEITTGVPLVDTQVANALLRAAPPHVCGRAARPIIIRQARHRRLAVGGSRLDAV